MKAKTSYTCSNESASGVRKPYSIETKTSRPRSPCSVSLLAAGAGNQSGQPAKPNETEELMAKLNHGASSAARSCITLGNIGAFSCQIRRALALQQRLHPAKAMSMHPLRLIL
jgi:hypothetical protein